MRKFFGKAALFAATGLAMAAMMPAAASAAVTFTFDTGGTNSSGTYGDVRTFTGSDGTKVEVTAYSICTSTGKTGSCPSSTVPKGQTVLQTAYVGQYAGYGLGVTDRSEDGSSPNHTVDNSGWTDILVLQFSKSVDVTKLGMTAWGDTDITYAAGQTNVPFSGTLNFTSWAGLDADFDPFNASNGNSMSDGSNFSRTISGGDIGNLFFISAAMPNPDKYSDYVKLKSLTEVPCVPEPATWGMMVIGFGALGATMRRRKATKATVSFA